MLTLPIKKSAFLLLVLYGTIILLRGVYGGAVAAVGTETETAVAAGLQNYIFYAENVTSPRHVDPPASFLSTAQGARCPARSAITVNYIGSWDQQARDAFEYAADIWETLLVSNVPITVDAEWENLGPDILGGAGPYNFYKTDEVPGILKDTWYPVAITNSRNGGDLVPENPDISASFNSGYNDWYYGTDGNTPGNKIDFASVVLHELGHGLGFVGSMTVFNGLGYWGLTNDGGVTYFPIIYDRFTENGADTKLLNLGQGTSSLAFALTAGSSYFDGNNARAAYGNRVPLFTPSIWQQGSSYSHLDEIFDPYNGGESALMTFSIGDGETIHHPGVVTLGIFADIHWLLAEEPTINDSSALVLQGGSYNDYLDMAAYSCDPQTADPATLSYTLIDAGAPNAGISLTNGHFISINPTGGYTGTTTASVQVSDGTNSDTATISVYVAADVEQMYLPGTLNE